MQTMINGYKTVFLENPKGAIGHPVQQTPKKKSKRKPSEQKRKALIKHKNNIVTSRSLNLIYNDGKNMIFLKGNLSYKARWIIDCWTDEIMKNKNGDKIPDIKLTENQIRSKLGFTSKKLSNDEIYDIATHEISELILKGYFSIFDEKKNSYINKEIHGGIFCIEIVEKMKEKKGRYEVEKRTYRFLLQDAGRLIWENLLQNRFSILRKPFYQLSKNSQEIYRKIIQFSGGSRYKVTTLKKILGYKETDNKTIKYKQRQLINKSLKELEDKGFIKYNKSNKGEETVYSLFPIRRNGYTK